MPEFPNEHDEARLLSASSESSKPTEEFSDQLGETPPASDDDEFRIAAGDNTPASAWDAAIQKQLDRELEHGTKFVPVEMAEEPIRFSLRETLILTACTAFLFALFRLMSPAYFAGMLGLLTFFWLVAMSMFRPQKSIFQVGWWVLLTVYLIASVVAMVQR